MKKIFFLLIAMSFYTLTMATDYYVETSANGGNDSNNGSSGSPFATLQKASTVAVNKGDVIYIGEGTFIENIDISSIEIAPGVDVIGEGMDLTLIEPNGPAGIPMFKFFSTDGDYENGDQIIQGFTIDGLDKTVHKGIYIRGRHNVKIYNVRIKNFKNIGMKIYSREANSYAPTFIKGIEVADCKFIDCGYPYSSGHISPMLELAELEGADIHHNYFHNFNDTTPGKGIESREENGWLKRSRIHHNEFYINTVDKVNKWHAIAIETCRMICETEVYRNYINGWVSFVKMINAVSEQYGNVSPDEDPGQYALIYHHNFQEFPENTDKQGLAVELTSAGDFYAHHNYIYHPKGNAYTFSWAGIDPDNEENLFDNYYDTVSSNIRIENDVLITPNGAGFSSSPNNTNESLEKVRFFNNTVFNSKTGFLFGDGYYENNTNRHFKDYQVKNNIFLCTFQGIHFSQNEVDYTDITIDNNLFIGMANGNEIYGHNANPEITISNKYTGENPGLTLSGDTVVPYFRPSDASSWVVGKGIDLGNPAGTTIGAYNYTDPVDDTIAVPTPLFPADLEQVSDKKPVISWLGFSDPSEVIKYEISLDGTIHDVGLRSSYIPPTNLGDGTHFWKVRAADNAGNVGEWSRIYAFSINQAPSVINASASSNSPICEGENLTLEETGGEATSWEWWGPNGFTSTQQNPTISNASPEASGTYVVTAKGSGIQERTAEVSVTVHSNPTLNAGPDDSTHASKPLIISDFYANSHANITWSSSGNGTFNYKPALFKALAFGADFYTTKVKNDTTRYYTKINQNGFNFGYAAYLGHGYVETGNDLDATPNNSNNSPCGEELYDQYIGLNTSGSLTFRIKVPDGTYKFVAVMGNSSSNNHNNTLKARDGSSGTEITLVDNVTLNANNYAVVTFDDKTVPECSEATFNTQPESPVLPVTSGYIEIIQSSSGAGGDLVLLEIWKTDSGQVYYMPGSNDIADDPVNVTLTLTAQGLLTCTNASDNMTLTVTTEPLIDMGIARKTCVSGTFTPDATASYHDGLTWSTSGDGNFDDNTILETTYTPGSNDIASGQTTLSLTASGLTSYADSTKSLTLTITGEATANAGFDATISPTDSFVISYAIAANHDGISWSTSGDGTFSDHTIIRPTYYPGPNDIQNGSITLTLTAKGNGSCNDAIDNITLSIPTGTNNFAAETINVYPNPAKDKFFVQAPANSRISLTSIEGKTIWTKIVNGNTEFQAPAIPGTYLVKIVKGEKTSVKQIVVQ